MGPRTTYGLIAFAMILLMVLFFSFNPSYEKSVEAKYYYMIGEYKQAYTLALESSKIDTYNKMAITILSQSERALKFVVFIDEAKLYMQRIEVIAEKEGVTTADRAKIKIMCQIILEKYEKLSASVITDKELVQEALMYRNKFEKLYEKITI